MKTRTIASLLLGTALTLLAAADAVGELGHLVEHGMNLRHDVLAVDDDGRASRRPQRHVQDRAIFRDVDFLAPEHRVDSFAQPGLLGELDEQAQRLVLNAIFRIIQEHTGGFRRHPLPARGILREQVAQVPTTHCSVVIFERTPYGGSARRSRARHLRSCSHLWHLSDQIRGFEWIPVCGRARSSPHRRNPPRKALALSPPITVSSGSSAAMKRATTSAT